ncbi:hypothetical protein G7054_g12910 [Neopestalotiopsis clavispora]|nr:hypothetical protein G7054_g12910 [Neopestalotiopsis clavispora]
MTANGANSYGRRLLPHVVDELRDSNPTRVHTSYPRTADVKDGFLDFTMADLGHSVDYMAAWIENKFGKSNSFETITYIALSDLRGLVTFLAAVKTGYKLLITSPRNSAVFNESLMEQTKSTKILFTDELAPLLKPLKDLVPSRKSKLVAGMPKPIIMTHGSFAAVDYDHNVPAPPGRKKRDTTYFAFEEETRIFLVFPFFHLGGFWFNTCLGIFRNVTFVVAPPHIAPDVEMLKEMARQQDLKGAMVVPALLQAILHDPEGMDFLRGLKFAFIAGAPAAESVGDQASTAVELFNWIGSTETFPMPELYKSREDWLYHELSCKHEMQLYDASEGTYELVILADETNKDNCPVYHNLPGVNPYHTKDLFVRHPTKPNLYKYFGRRDDIIVLANGEKVNPIPLEQYVQGHPSVMGALLVGNERSQTALLVEPKEPLNSDATESFLQALRLRIEQANAKVPGPARVAPGKVICATSDKPFARTAKNTIVRKTTERSYESEIEAAYSAPIPQPHLVNISLETTVKIVYEPAKLLSFLRLILSPSFPPASSIGESEDFFAYGLDSVQTLEITASLKRNLQSQTSKSFAWLSPRIIFRNSSLADLSKVLASFLNEGVSPLEDTQIQKVLDIDDAVARHTSGLPGRLAKGSNPGKISTVAVIGSTGYLGLYSIASLLKDVGISKVYCLNRGVNAKEKQNAALVSLDSTLESHLDKLTYLQVELGKPLLGLSQDQYSIIASEVDAIVYNSWRLDFGIAIRSFEPFLRAARDLVDLSVASQGKMRIIFISSVSSVENLAAETTIPEAPVEDARAALNMGYGQSKLAAERILITANRHSGVPVSIVRVGQVGGPSKASAGVWADQQWISAIIRSSKNLGSFPGTVVPIDWIPVDTVAVMLRAFITADAQDDVQVFNVVNDKPQPWGMLVDIVREKFGITQIVSFRDWVSKLENIDSPSPEDAKRLPALKMMDWYKTLGDGTDTIGIETSRAREISKVEIPVIDKELLTSWLQGWGL